MKQRLTLNCDLGESSAGQVVGMDEAVMPHVHLANIACGFHAGDASIMQDTVALAIEHGVGIGAHPSYNDPEHFGRRSMDLPDKEITEILHQQIATLDDIAARQGEAVQHVKPHGALYNDMMANRHTREVIMAAIASYHRPLPLILLATPQAQEHRAEAQQTGIDVLFEAFADRAYTDEGHLLSRSEPNAVLGTQQMLAQVTQIFEHASVTTHNGNTLEIAADTLCVHGDNPQGVAAIVELRALIDKHCDARSNGHSREQ